MTRIRIVAAIAALLTALLVQASIIGPLALSLSSVTLSVSLPAVLVAAIALVDGPGAGLAFGFAAGLVADLGSDHPAGVLALCWLGIGVVGGLGAAEHTSVRRDAFLAAVICGVGALVAGLILAAVGADGASIGVAVRGMVPTALVDGLLASGVVPLVRLFLRADALRAPQSAPVLGEPR